MVRARSLRLRPARALCAALLVPGLLAGCASAPAAPAGAIAPAEWMAMAGLDAGATAPAAAARASDDGHGVLHTALLYLPNRLFDVLDIVRLRARVGPGFAADVRATQLADAFAGFYSSVFAGLPGPRTAPFINWPIGFENRSGAELSLVDVSSGGRSGTHYGVAEFGLGLHLAILGLDVGVDPWELVDFATGLMTIDLVGDDL